MGFKPVEKFHGQGCRTTHGIPKAGNIGISYGNIKEYRENSRNSAKSDSLVVLDNLIKVLEYGNVPVTPWREHYGMCTDRKRKGTVECGGIGMEKGQPAQHSLACSEIRQVIED